MAQRPSLPRLARRPVAAALLATLAACGGTPGATPTPGGGSASPSNPNRTAPHVMVVVLENQEYGSVVGSAAMPYFNQLAAKYGLATAYHARTHPSLPNYLDLIAGSTLDITSDCTACHVDGDTIVDQLAKNKVHWTAYMGGMPDVCYQGADYPANTDTGYAKKHDPFMYFTHLRNDPRACGNIVPESRLATDLGGTDASPFLWVSPTLCDDGHNTTDRCGPAATDRWLSTTVPQVLQSSWYAQGGIVVVTFDEGATDSASSCCGGAHGGHVATLVISKDVKPGARMDTPVDHAGTLRTIEALYGVPYLRTAADPQSGDLMPLLGRQPLV
jgi:phosphatidylinositol-3-phosphatase